MLRVFTASPTGIGVSGNADVSRFESTSAG